MSYKLSYSIWENEEALLHNLTILAGGKYLDMNALANSIPVVMVCLGNECIHCFALPLKENGNELNHIKSFETPLILKLLQISTKVAKILIL